MVGQCTVFRDVADLAKGRVAMTHSFVEQLITVGCLHAVGFPCKSVSMLNPTRKRFKMGIKDKSGSTGITCWSSWRFFRRFLPVLVWMENVRGFKGRNLNLAIKLLRQLGYCVVVLMIDVNKHGIPCRRQHCWMIAKLAPSACCLESCDSMQRRAEELEVALRKPPLPLSSFFDPG